MSVDIIVVEVNGNSAKDVLHLRGQINPVIYAVPRAQPGKGHHMLVGILQLRPGETLATNLRHQIVIVPRSTVVIDRKFLSEL